MDKINKITTSKQTTMYDHLYKMKKYYQES